MDEYLNYLVQAFCAWLVLSHFAAFLQLSPHDSLMLSQPVSSPLPLR